MNDEPVNHPLFRLFTFICGAPLSLAGSLFIYVAVYQWATYYGVEGVWIIIPSEILAPVGATFLLIGSASLFFAFRRKTTWPETRRGPTSGPRPEVH